MTDLQPAVLLPPALAELQSLAANAPQAGGSDFAAVLDRVSSLADLAGGGLGTSGQSGGAASGGLSASGQGVGWPLEEGSLGTGSPALSAGLLGAQAFQQPYVSSSSSALEPAAAPSSATMSAPGAPYPPGLATSSPALFGQAVVSQAEKYLGVPYVWGGTNPAVGVDCSGLVQDVFASLGTTLPRTSQQQALAGTAVPDLAAAQPGDLVFYPGSDGTVQSPGHVGIYIGNGQMIDAPFTGADVRVDPVGQPSAIRRIAPPQSVTEAPMAQAASAAPYSAQLASASAAYSLPQSLLAAVANTESGYNPSAVSGAGAEGLMQLMPSTAQSLGANPFDPAQAISAAARLLAGYKQQFGSWPLALAAYNAGPAAVQAYGGVPPYAETQAYVQGILSKAGLSSSSAQATSGTQGG